MTEKKICDMISSRIGRSCQRELSIMDVAVLICAFVWCNSSCQGVAEEPRTVEKPLNAPKFISGRKELSLTELVKDLGYPDKIAADFIEMVYGWKNEGERSLVLFWKGKLDQAHQSYRQGKTSQAELVQTEAEIVGELGHTVLAHLTHNSDYYHLTDLIKYKQTQCLGYSQVVYILSTYVGLRVKLVDVTHFPSGESVGEGHVAPLIELADRTVIFLDLMQLPVPMVSKPFRLEEEYERIGNHFELRDKTNPLKIHRRIRIANKDYLLACVHQHTATKLCDASQFDDAYDEYSKAMDLDPNDCSTYWARARLSRGRLRKYKEALDDCVKAIELDPKCQRAYFQRGMCRVFLCRYQEAISDFTKALDLDPEYVEAYASRAGAYRSLGELYRAASEYTVAIKLGQNESRLALLYLNRGIIYRDMAELSKASADFDKAVELNSELSKLIPK
ncbi:MAG: tetratricopeptide repeat protein [Phycisphaerales bacterium]|nr:MAG: tetratricopeptide repeat protein [Phycisphaerales bacterium]